MPYSDTSQLKHKLIKIDSHQKTVIIYTSPQALTGNKYSLIKYLVDKGLIRQVVILCTQFQRRIQIDENNILCKQLSSNPNTMVLFLTATCTSRIKSHFEQMIGTNATHQHWPLVLETSKRKKQIRGRLFGQTILSCNQDAEDDVNGRNTP